MQDEKLITQALEEAKANAALEAQNPKEEVEKKPFLFVDMDGTLSTLKEFLSGDQFLQPGYFLDLEPENNMCDALRELKNTTDLDICICSAVQSANEITEKKQWLQEHIPALNNPTHLLFVAGGNTKAQAISEYALKNPQVDLKNSYLLDDYTANLNNVQNELGVQGIKYLNGMNHTRQSWDGASVVYTAEPHDIAETIKDIVGGREVDVMLPDIKDQVEADIKTGDLHLLIELYDFNHKNVASKHIDAFTKEDLAKHISYIGSKGKIFGGLCVCDSMNRKVGEAQMELTVDTRASAQGPADKVAIGQVYIHPSVRKMGLASTLVGEMQNIAEQYSTAGVLEIASSAKTESVDEVAKAFIEKTFKKEINIEKVVSTAVRDAIGNLRNKGAFTTGGRLDAILEGYQHGDMMGRDVELVPTKANMIPVRSDIKSIRQVFENLATTLVECRLANEILASSLLPDLREVQSRQEILGLADGGVQNLDAKAEVIKKLEQYKKQLTFASPETIEKIVDMLGAELPDIKAIIEDIVTQEPKQEAPAKPVSPEMIINLINIIGLEALQEELNGRMSGNTMRAPNERLKGVTDDEIRLAIKTVEFRGKENVVGAPDPIPEPHLNVPENPVIETTGQDLIPEKTNNELPLKEAFEKAGVFAIEDRRERMTAALVVLIPYCKNCDFNVSRDDLQVIVGEGLQQVFTQERASHVKELALEQAKSADINSSDR